jgi:hypothetical protein
MLKGAPLCRDMLELKMTLEGFKFLQEGKELQYLVMAVN